MLKCCALLLNILYVSYIFFQLKRSYVYKKLRSIFFFRCFNIVLSRPFEDKKFYLRVLLLCWVLVYFVLLLSNFYLQIPLKVSSDLSCRWNLILFQPLKKIITLLFCFTSLLSFLCMSCCFVDTFHRNAIEVSVTLRDRRGAPALHFDWIMFGRVTAVLCTCSLA